MAAPDDGWRFMKREALAARLLATFLSELDDQLQTMTADLLALEETPDDRERLRSLFRGAHTLKGAASAAGVPAVASACHILESMLAAAREGETRLDPDKTAFLFSALDALQDAGRRLKAGDPLEERLLDRRSTPREDGPGVPRAPASDPTHPLRSAPEESISGPEPSTEARPHEQEADGPVRVDAGKLGDLLAATRQLLLSRDGITMRSRDLQTMNDAAKLSARDWEKSARALRGALRSAGAPDTSLSAVDAADETVNRLVREARQLSQAAAADARMLSRVSDEVSDRVHDLRMRPFSEACEALPRTVRDLSAVSQKMVRLEIEGGDVEADRSVLDGLREAILALVRNAVDHGIEPPHARVLAGKSREGRIRVTAQLLRDRIVVQVQDDGAGLDIPAIRARLEDRGRPVPSDDLEVARAMFEGDVSTRSEASAISGRGVGLDIVRAAVERVRGTVDVSWEPGGGTTFTIECAPGPATIRAVLVSVGPHTLAIPTAHVEHLLRVAPEDVRHVEDRPVITHGDGPVPLVSLARLLPPLPERPAEGMIPVVLCTTGSRRLAVAVDAFIAEQELVLQPLRAEGDSLPHVSGAALLATGKIALVLNMVALMTTALAPGGSVGLTMAERDPASAVRHRILVVDDSLTTRTLEQSILEAAGYSVQTAVDGADGWRRLQEDGADLVVSDVEMPKMDGFALCEAIRRSKRFSELPVVLITALETPAHRSRGLEVGADAYIAKSSFDQQGLIDVIRELLG